MDVEIATAAAPFQADDEGSIPFTRSTTGSFRRTSNNLLNLRDIRPTVQYKRAAQMAFRMAGMTRAKSGAFKARKGIPKDVRDDYQALYGLRWEELFRAPAGCPLHRAKVLRSEWEAEIDSRIAALRAKQRGEGHDLSQRAARALAGEWYRWFVGQHEENPGKSSHWKGLRDAL
jgi:hypothetical protein